MNSDRRVIPLLQEIGVAEANSEVRFLTGSPYIGVSAHAQWKIGQKSLLVSNLKGGVSKRSGAEDSTPRLGKLDETKLEAVYCELLWSFYLFLTWLNHAILNCAKKLTGSQLSLQYGPF